MKCIIKIIIFAVFLLNTVFTYAQDCVTKLIVSSDYVDTHYYLNDSLVGKGNTLDVQTEPGKYILVVMENSDRWNAKTIVDTIELIRCETKRLNYKLRSEILIRTEPSDSEVFSNGKYYGRTPVTLSLSNGNISLRKKGFAEKEIQTGKFSSDDIIKLDYIGNANELSFFQKDIFKILMGSIVILGGTSAYFKMQADDKFDEYQITGSGEALDQTRKYDLISGILFGAVQINFGVLIYYFLVE